jgi:hypothetical protein
MGEETMAMASTRDTWKDRFLERLVELRRRFE